MFVKQNSNSKFSAGIAKHTVCLSLSSVTPQTSDATFLISPWIAFVWKMEQWSCYRNRSSIKQGFQQTASKKNCKHKQCLTQST